MTDFWCTFGLMTIDATLWPAVLAQNPKFRRTISITLEDNIVIPHCASGILDATSTVALRTLLQGQFTARFGTASPTASLYTAGKLCQLANTDSNALQDAASLAQAAYLATAPGGFVPSVRLVTLMGAALIDDGLIALLTGPGSSIASDLFFIDPQPGNPDWAFLLLWLNNPNVTRANQILAVADGWRDGCDQRQVFYSGFIRAAN